MDQSVKFVKSGADESYTNLMSGNGKLPKDMLEWLLLVLCLRTPIAMVQFASLVLMWLGVIWYSYDYMSNLPWLTVTGLVIAAYHGLSYALTVISIPWESVKKATVGSASLRPVAVELTPDQLSGLFEYIGMYKSALLGEVAKQRSANAARFTAIATVMGLLMAVIGLALNGFWIIVTLSLIVVSIPALYSQGLLSFATNMLGGKSAAQPRTSQPSVKKDE